MPKSPDITTDDMAAEELGRLRQQIDLLDDKLLRLLEERIAVAAAVAAAKTAELGTPDKHDVGRLWRPGREAQLLGRLIAASSLPGMLIEGIWRQITTANLQGQTRLRFAMVKAADHLADAAIETTVNWRFGPTVPRLECTSHAAAMAALASGEAMLAVMPHWQDDASWLPALAAVPGCHIMAVAPLHISGLQRLAILGAGLPDPSGNDETLVFTADGKRLESHTGYHPGRKNLAGIIQVLPSSADDAVNEESS